MVLSVLLCPCCVFDTLFPTHHTPSYDNRPASFQRAAFVTPRTTGAPPCRVDLLCIPWFVKNNGPSFFVGLRWPSFYFVIART